MQSVLRSALLCLVIVAQASAQPVDLAKFEAMKARSIGPAGMSGRVTALDVVRRNPAVLYVGTASGGLWKSTDAGTTFTPIFDDQPVASIGAIAINQSNPDVVWVGTGEGNPRNSQTNGNGMYKSIDGGRTWTFLGLAESRTIHRVLLHPTNPDVAYAAVMGPAWGETTERGLFKTSDGGATWQKILYVNERTGIGELVMDPVNPEKLLAATWEFRRWPWFFTSGGEGSGLHVTYDGGKTWTKRTDKDGLPKGELGRIGLAIAASRPNVVYALVEAKKNVLLRSDDGGHTFRTINDTEDITDRPFYYNDLYVDPQNENRLYHIAGSMRVSEDGGKTYRAMNNNGPGYTGGIHVDHHAFWINPDNPAHLIEGNDGGMSISMDYGRSWRYVENLPLAQFYHIAVDMAIPYRVMGGMQDNGSWVGPSEVWKSGGIRNADWQEVAFGDGFDVIPDPADDRWVYAMSQGGALLRTNRETGEAWTIRPVHPDGVRLRFNWNAGFAQDPFDAGTIYYGSQFLHKSTDRGSNWTIISPDLTTNDPEKQQSEDSGGLTYDVTSAENHTTILAIAPSPVERGVIWVGTDDGNVQLTRDGGATWENVVSRIRGVPANTWVPQIRASRYGGGEAYVVFDDHRRNNWEPYVFRTKDYGKTWTRIADATEVWGYALAIEQDPVEPRLFFLGTEFGLYVSFDGAETWQKWTHGFPTVSTMDLVIHPRDHDLVIGTFGRAAYVLDDIRPLRAIARDRSVLSKPLAAFAAPTAFLAERASVSGSRFTGSAMFAGENRPSGALLSYWITKPDSTESAGASSGEGAGGRGGSRDEVKIEVLDATGAVIRTTSGPAENGLNRTTWGLERKGFRMGGGRGGSAQRTEPGGPSVAPGTYTVRFTYKETKDSTTVRVEADPRAPFDVAAHQARGALYDSMAPVFEATGRATEMLDRMRTTAEWLAKRYEAMDDSTGKALLKENKAVLDSLKSVREALNGPEGRQGIARQGFTPSARVGQAMGYIGRNNQPPGETEEVAIRLTKQAAEEVISIVNAFARGRWAEYMATVKAANLSWFGDFDPVDLPN